MSPGDEEISDEEIKIFLESIKRKTNYDFTDYSIKSLKRRIAKILSDSKLSICQLEKEALSNPQFMEKVVMSITVNTTELFRDPAIWRSIRDEVLPKFSSHPKISVWHAGCSTGQEVYSMMIVLEEAGFLSKTEIYASDINSDVLDVAKAGIYKYRFNHAYIENFDRVMNGHEHHPGEGNRIPYTKYFSVDKVSDSIRMKSFLTEKPIYRKIDLVSDGNLFETKFDIIICRNVIIYFNNELQNKVFDLFYNNLFNQGCLILGLHESILGHHSSRFEKKNHVYFKNLK